MEVFNGRNYNKHTFGGGMIPVPDWENGVSVANTNSPFKVTIPINGLMYTRVYRVNINVNLYINNKLANTSTGSEVGTVWIPVSKGDIVSASGADYLQEGKIIVYPYKLVKFE